MKVIRVGNGQEGEVAENERPTSSSDDDENEDEVEEEKEGRRIQISQQTGTRIIRTRQKRKWKLVRLGATASRRRAACRGWWSFQKAREATKTKTAATDSVTWRRAECADDQSTTRCHTILTVPVQGVTLEQQQAIDDFVIQLEEIKETAPAIHHRLCLQVLRHYRDSRPI